MTFTYTDPGTILKDKVRLLVKDNVQARAILSDEDLVGIAASYPDATPTNRQRFLVAYEAAAVLYAHWLRVASAQVGPLRIEGTRRAEESKNLMNIYYNLGHGMAPGSSVPPLPTGYGLTLVDPDDELEPLFSRTSPP